MATALFALLAALAAVLLAAAAESPAPGWKAERRADGSEEVKLTFWLHLQHTDELKKLLEEVSDPQNPKYGHYLTKEQTDALTAPRAEDIRVVEGALRGHQLHSENMGGIMWAVVRVDFAEELLGGQFLHFCNGQAGDRSCVLRNPTAKVPDALRAACDIIQPIDDPFPPERSPILVSREAAAAAPGALQQQPQTEALRGSAAKASSAGAASGAAAASGRPLMCCPKKWNAAWGLGPACRSCDAEGQTEDPPASGAAAPDAPAAFVVAPRAAAAGSTEGSERSAAAAGWRGVPGERLLIFLVVGIALAALAEAVKRVRRRTSASGGATPFLGDASGTHAARGAAE
eukprot:TRINITY_DN28002_c0_g1_i1.p1 TRINITY_DN28002_c0_g1~~TRINITY_DN28002_c0_g1_i1.p1  ORF type:complete len:371 (+),score=101.53 TRINITY_DN28002_c0_g1_i1:81-1115(+)